MRAFSAKAMLDAGYSVEQVEGMIRIRYIIGTCQLVGFGLFLFFFGFSPFRDSAPSADNAVPAENGVAATRHVDDL